MTIILKDLPKISLNQWYSGTHWSERVKIKNTYKVLVKSQCKHVFKKDFKYSVTYHFGFKNNPLDASNCVAMVKMIEDILFEDDGYKIVVNINILSTKSDKDFVKININKLE